MMRAPVFTLRGIGGAALLAALLALAGCGTAPQQPSATQPAAGPRGKPQQEPGVPVLPPAGSGRGGYYQDDGPGENPPPNLMATPDAEVRDETPIPRSNKPYTVFGKNYAPITDPKQTFVQRGLGTWYGKKFHGQRTSSGELYDMYKMTAAHPTLPIPSYAKVTNLDNGKQVVVRINDRGPFHSTRVIDVSYTAALKLGLLTKGSHQLEVERILPGDAARFNAARAQQQQEAQAAPPASSAPPAASAAGTATAGTAASPTAIAPPAMPRAAPLIYTPQAASDGAAPPAGVFPTAGNASGAGATLSPAVAAMPAPPAPNPSGAAATARSGFYLQLGAYARADNAEAVRVKLSNDTTLSGLEVVPSGDVQRLYSGPYATRQEAAQAILGLPPALGLKPLIIQR
jgi:rare lipoprotein A